MTEMDPLRRERGGDHGQQIGAMDRDVRRAIKPLAKRVERRALQGAAILPTALMAADRMHTFAVEAFAQAQPIKDARGVRAHIDAAADFGQLRRLLVDIDFEPGLAQSDGGAEPADAAADHGDLAREPSSQRPLREISGGQWFFAACQWASASCGFDIAGSMISPCTPVLAVNSIM